MSQTDFAKRAGVMTSKARLSYEIGVEWNIPDPWGSCTLIVDASRDTTFALYEFE